MTLGDQLATARTKRGLTLEELATRTKIPLGRLRALENGLYERLPPPIFTRGYVRACAIEVGLDPEDLNQQFEGERPLPAAPEPPPKPAPDIARPSLLSPGANVAVGTLALLAVVALIWVARDRPEASGGAPVDRGSAPVAVAPSADMVGTAGTVAEPQGIALKLTADRVCWVSVSADGRRAIYRLMQPGERETVHARERILLRIGDAGALSISVNGGAPQVVGADGEVRSMALTANREATLAQR